MSKKIDDLYFGIKLFSLSYSEEKELELETYNLFSFGRIKWAVATYIVRKKEIASDPLHFCFADVWGRCEYEYLIRPFVSNPKLETKIDVFSMYVEPNAKLLMEMVNDVSLSSAKKYLAEERKRFRAKK